MGKRATVMPRPHWQCLARYCALALAGFLSAASAGATPAKIIESDVCVFGGTSGGVVAAVQAARMGKRAVIAEPGRHLGGMTSGGLSAVDVGEPRAVGGLAREYFTKLAATAGTRLAWDKPFEAKGGGPASGGAYAIEPHQAAQLFDTMAREAGVIIHVNARLASIKKQGPWITELATENGTVFRSKIFIDATYEGDLMAKAGVAHTLEREGNAKYGESLNGIHYAEKFMPRTNHLKPGPNGRVPGGQGVWDRDFPLDPYIRPGDPGSGLLPLIQDGDPGTQGDPAAGIQAYCYRLCLTTDPANSIAIAPPDDYDPARYEIVARFIAACLSIGDDMDLRWFSKHDPLPNNKWDFNTATFGGNLPGASRGWPEADYATREKIAKEHEDYHRGLLHFLATDPRVPEKVRRDMARFGLPRDEFTDNGGWPHQLYVREARRMVSDLVMTEHHTFGRRMAPDPIGLGAYGTDVHEIRRIVRNGVVIREGKIATGRGGAPPYPIGYGAIVPKASECANLFVTFALSASHTAFASIRMEPVFMILSQSAATAGSLAIDEGIPVQAVDRGRLRRRLLEDGQILEWPGAAKPAADNHGVDAAAAVAVSPMSPETVRRPPAQRPQPEPVQLAKDATPEDVDGRSFDAVVIGATGGGIACAVRAAREGCSVLLVQHNRHIGGMMSNGLMQWDALYGGRRAPLFTELLKNIEHHYIANFGQDSPTHQTIRYTHEHYPIGWAEPSVAEREFNRLVAHEKNITLLLGYCASAVKRDGRLVRETTLCPTPGAGAQPPNKKVRVAADIFVDATYEGDLFAVAKAPYRVGREGRDEFGEPHAGVIFCNIDRGRSPMDAVEGRLNIRPYSAKQGSIDPGSPFTADDNVQAYNYRFCVTKDPANRIIPASPPPGYKREEYVNYERKGIATNAGPNNKSHMNSPILPGENGSYPEADWPAREKITRRHLNFALGLMYFLQNDESVPAKKRAEFRQWGLPRDEFAGNDHVPYEMYVREARRIIGQHIFTEHDNSLAQGLGRTPIFADSVATTDWYMDSHSCTTNSRPGFHYDGKLILTEESRPAQIPYRCLLPRDIDNMLVPICLSASHVAWGAVRLEPVWMQIGEAAGLAAALAKKHSKPPAALNPDQLIRALAERRHMITFFNDVPVGGTEPWVTAMQYLGTRGFFHDYDARPNAPLDAATGAVWARGFSELRAGKGDPMALALSVAEVERQPGAPMTADQLAALLPVAGNDAVPQRGGVLTRAKAAQVLWEALNKEPPP